MPKKRFSTKEDRMAEHIAASEKKRGMSPKAAKSVGYATVVKRGGGKKKKGGGDMAMLKRRGMPA